MKKSFYLIAALSVGALSMAAFSSCSSDGSLVAEREEQTAKIELTLTGANTRANGTTAPSESVDGSGNPTGEQVVNNIVVGIFDGNNKVLTVQEISHPKVGTGTENSNTLTCLLSTGGSYSGCSAVALANMPSATVSNLKNATSKLDFLSKTTSLQYAVSVDDNEDGNGDGTTQLSTYLPMSGDVKDGANATFTLTPGASTTGLSVSLVRMVSRITLKSIKADFSGTPYAGATFSLTRVFLRDALKDSKVVTNTNKENEPSATLTATNYITGGGTWTPNGNGGGSWGTDNTFLSDDISSVAIGTSASDNLPGGKYYWFYAFANDNDDDHITSGFTPTAFVIQGLFDPDGAGTAATATTVFYPVIIGRTQTGTTFEHNTGSAKGHIIRNSLYDLKINIKGKGAASPTDNINPANLEINVSVDPWNTTIEAQDVTFD